MCGRYTLFAPRDNLERRFDAAVPDSLGPSYNCAPGQSLPVVTNDAPDSVRRLRWGFVPRRAGIWERWRPSTVQTGLDDFDPATAERGEPDPVEAFAVLTTEPNDPVADLHDRMAVVLDPAAERRWLSTGDESALDPHPADELRAYPVSTRVNDPSNDSPALIEPVDA